ncbi:MAG: carbamate kinase [Pseudomonadota bacterium]|nr:carbamate kinase [Pseudomonadota bacterium]
MRPTEQRSAVRERLLIAVGGNAIHPEGIRGTSEEQMQVAAETAQYLLPLLQQDNELVVTHGNGPGVGKTMMRQALSRHRVAPMSLDICVANTQGVTAYILMQAFENALRRVGSPRHAVGLVTQVEVDPADPAFASPSKPVGYFFDQQQAADLAEEFGWTLKEDAGRGWRQVVPSPEPQHICDISLIDALARRGTIVIAGGGGGIPVVRDKTGIRHGVEGVIDKDLTSAHMATVLGIPKMVILTGVSRVAINFGRDDEQEIDYISVAELRGLQLEGHFPPGSMGPKVEAALRFVEAGGSRAIITGLKDGPAAMAGRTGTHVVSNHPRKGAIG